MATSKGKTDSREEEEVPFLFPAQDDWGYGESLERRDGAGMRDLGKHPRRRGKGGLDSPSVARAMSQVTAAM